MERVGDDLPEDLGREVPQRREAAARAAASVGLVLWREHGSELVEVVALVVRPYHQRCGDARAPLESFRLSQILSFGPARRPNLRRRGGLLCVCRVDGVILRTGGLVVAEDSDGEDVALFEDIIRVEKKFYGDWSKETRQLLADGDALAAYKRRAFDLYRQRFAPEALLRRVDAWNERGAPDGWQDS